jgi:hypothetical protein
MLAFHTNVACIACLKEQVQTELSSLFPEGFFAQIGK